MTLPNYIYEKGAILVAPGGGGALTPLNPGSEGQILTINEGVPSYQNAGGFGPQNVNVIFSDYDFIVQPTVTYTPPTGFNFIITSIAAYFTSMTDYDPSGDSNNPILTLPSGFGNLTMPFSMVDTTTYGIGGSANGFGLGDFASISTIFNNSNPFIITSNTPAVATSLIGNIILIGILVAQ
jgi:hypothetical protein